MFEAEAQGAETISARADARTIVPMQFGVRGMRKIQYAAHILKSQLSPDECYKGGR